MAIHSRIGGSKASQWLNCPGSVINQALVNIEAPMIDSSPYAAEGTEAHKIAELIVNGWQPPNNVDADMLRYARQYKAGLKSLELMYPGISSVEATYHAPNINQDFFGTIDYKRFSAKHDLTIIVDYKYGAGEYVSPVKNPQLLTYSVGASELQNRYTLNYKLAIFQPRGDNPGWRFWDTTFGEVNSFRKTMMLAIDEVEAGNVETKAGKWCRWCLAKTHCKAFFDANIKPVLEFKGKLVGLSKQEIVDLREKKEPINQWMKGVDDYLKAACMLSEDGQIGGWQPVKQKGMTEWTDKIGVELAYPRDKYPNMYKNELRTPKQAIEAHPELKNELEYSYTQREFTVLKRVNADFSEE